MIEISVNQDDYNRIVEAIKPLEKSEESVLKTAVNNAAKKAQKLLAKKTKRVYGGEAPEGVLERSNIRKATTSNLSVKITFRSEQPGLDKFRTNATAMVTKPVWIGGTHIKFPVRATQFKREALKDVENAFAIQAKNGKKLLVVRSGKGKTRGHEKKEWGYDKVKALMGSSDMVMVRNEKVYGAVSEDIGDMIHLECQKALDRALAKGK